MSTPTPANCSGLANAGVPVKEPGTEIAVPESGAKVHVERLKRDTHRAMPKFMQRTIRMGGNFVVAEPPWRGFFDGCRRLGHSWIIFRDQLQRFPDQESF
jgi:hypothetical protein